MSRKIGSRLTRPPQSGTTIPLRYWRIPVHVWLTARSRGKSLAVRIASARAPGCRDPARRSASGRVARMALVAGDLARRAGLRRRAAAGLPARDGRRRRRRSARPGARPAPDRGRSPVARGPGGQDGEVHAARSSHWSGTVRAPLAWSRSRSSRSFVTASTASAPALPAPASIAASEVRSRITSSAGPLARVADRHLLGDPPEHAVPDAVEHEVDRDGARDRRPQPADDRRRRRRPGPAPIRYSRFVPSTSRRVVPSSGEACGADA